MLPLLLALLPLPAAPAQDQAQPDPAIVVRHAGPDAEKRARALVDAVSPPLRFDEPMPRFTDPICPGVAGLPAAAAQAIVDQLGLIADSVGLRVGEPGCAPNLLVLAVPDGKAAVRRIERTRPGALNGKQPADIARILAEPGPARAWTSTETRARDGDAPSYAPGSPPVLAVSTSSRIAAPVRTDIVNAIVVIDRDAVAGRPLDQVAAYVAMRGLGNARPQDVAGAPSVLTLFTPKGDAGAPATLTAFDRAYLSGLYASRGDMPGAWARGAIVARAVEGADSPQPR
ncbi:hypothetical protein ACG3SL_02215 [Sphingomonas sp. CJ20]